jgi:Zn-finger nucleic acid-binding protein
MFSTGFQKKQKLSHLEDSMHCPVCNKEMIVLEYNNVDIDWCSICSGIWLDQGELALLAQTEKKHDQITELFEDNFNPEKILPGDKQCPVCSKKMGVYEIQAKPPIEVDICPFKHGIWFDKGELEKTISLVKDEPVGELFSSIFAKT